MDDISKVYGPATMTDAPMPTQPTIMPTTSSSSQSGGNGIATPAAIPDQSIPAPVLADELLSNVLNTKTRKIIRELQFTPTGALQIGNFEGGQSGDVRISPEGIVARDLSGNTTFALDGDTGDAIFAGEVRAKDFTIIDDQGLVSLSAFKSDSVQVLASGDITSGTYVDIAGATLTFQTERNVNVLVFLSVRAQLTNMNNSHEAEGLYILNIDGSNLGNIVLVMSDVEMYTAGYSTNYSRQNTMTAQQVIKLAAGTHTFKVQNKIIASSTEKLSTYEVDLSYLILGS